jgi:excinuclease ABC subunit B
MSATMCAPTSRGITGKGEMVGANLKTHLQHLEKEMRDAAADLDFERAARLRDEIKRLQETELAIADDPLARDAGVENTQKSRRDAAKGRGGKAKAAQGGSLFAKPELDEMGRSGDYAVPAGNSLFRKNTLDEMTVGRTENRPARPRPQNPRPKTRPS